MAERRHRLRLAAKPIERTPIVHEPAGQRLDRNLSAQPWIPCAVDFPHSPRANRRDDDVRAEACVGL
jgi:hypothetical protein